MTRRLALVLALLGGALRAQHFQSGFRRVALVELFTSEGCSSCPPAERWLGALKDNPGLWGSFVPVAFHVNYWDDLGWKDRLATPAYTARQYAYATQWRSHSVYTPCLVVDGVAALPGRPVDLERTNSAAGDLRLDLDGRTVRAAFSAARPGMRVQVALLAGGFSERVHGGENAGATLPMDFVVVALGEAPLSAAGAATLTLPPPTISPERLARRAIAAWVTAPGSPAPVQATGGWLKRG